jgi:hypothetical protein
MAAKVEALVGLVGFGFWLDFWETLGNLAIPGKKGLSALDSRWVELPEVCTLIV